jgi:hypothetical protein
MVYLMVSPVLRRLAVLFSRSRLRDSAQALACATRCLDGHVLLFARAMMPRPTAMAAPSAVWAVWARCSQHL